MSFSLLVGTMTLKLTETQGGTDFKVGGDCPPLKKSWGGHVPPCPLGIYAHEFNELCILYMRFNSNQIIVLVDHSFQYAAFLR